MKRNTTGHIRESLAETRRHKQTVAQKRERIAGLEVLLAMWEEKGTDPDYARELRARYNNTRNQLRAMRGNYDHENDDAR
jgi:hypothetical protein